LEFSRTRRSLFFRVGGIGSRVIPIGPVCSVKLACNPSQENEAVAPPTIHQHNPIIITSSNHRTNHHHAIRIATIRRSR
jgi:hypothetical protein